MAGPLDAVDPPRDKMTEVGLKCARAGVLVQWLKPPAWKVGDSGFEPHPGLRVSKKQKCLFPVHSQ